jgi:4-amino-4-deoxy-L-arabinose transferase-like glycosyltransferase
MRRHKSGHKWGDDFVNDIAHARNLASGLPYTQIGVIHNPRVVLGPSAYPPFFPLLLAPLYALFGLNLTAFKILVLLCSLGSLWVFDRWLKPRFSSLLRALALILVGLHPWYWNFKDQILSDMPFVLFCMLTFLLYDKRLRETGDASRNRSGWLIGITVSAAIATRSVGVILLAALVLDGLLHRRFRAGWFRQAVLLPFATLVLLNIILPSTGDYLSQTRGWDWNDLQFNLIAMLSIARDVWRSDILLLGAVSLIAVVGSALFLFGFGTRLKRIGPEEWLFLGTLAMILAWPQPQGFRFYLPIYFLF